MPFSHSGQLSAIVGFAEALAPVSILDVGTGMGQYGFLLRTNLENEHLFEVDGARARQRPREQWRVRIDGIEGYATYLTPVHDYVYDRMMIGDAMDILPTLPEAAYDLVMAIDILEHLTVEQGREFLAQLRRVAGRAALVSTPKQFCAQDIEANPFENHRSVWSEQDLHQAGYSTVIDNADSWIAVCTKSASLVD